MSETKNIEILKSEDDKNMKALIKSTTEHYIDTSFTNILRKFIISNIDTYTFYYINKENKNKNIKEIEINKDETKTNINNDMLAHRISLLTVDVFVLEILILFNYYKSTEIIPDIDTFEISQEDLYKKELQFKINKTYPSDQSSSDYIDVTEEDIKNDLFDELIQQKDDSDSDAKNYWEKLKENNNLNLNKIISKYNENTKEFDINKLRLFKPYIFNEKEYYNIITKITSGQGVKTSMYLMKSSVVGDNYTDNNIRYSPVAACRSTFVINYNKVLDLFRENNPNIFEDGSTDLSELKKILNSIKDNDELKKININDDDDEFKIKFNKFKYFCIEEGERYYYGINNQSERIHLLEYETVDFYNPKTILVKGLESLKNNKNKYHNIEIFYTLKNALVSSQMITDLYSINDSVKLQNALDILIFNGSHGLGYLMQTYLKYADENMDGDMKDKISYIGYKIIHPLENKLLLTIQCDESVEDIKKTISEIFGRTHEYLSKLVEKLIEDLE